MVTTTVSIQSERLIQGPISKEGMIVLTLLMNFGTKNIVALREQTLLIRSRFYKTMQDLEALNLVALNR